MRGPPTGSWGKQIDTVEEDYTDEHPHLKKHECRRA